VFLVATALLTSFLVASSPAKQTITYKGRSLDAWFYGARTNFFHQQTRRAAREAFDALGMSACPFLLAKLQSGRGNGFLYFKLYRLLPKRLQCRLPYPLLGDDVKMIALQHLSEMTVSSEDQLYGLAECVPRLRNPRLRLAGFQVIRAKLQTDPVFLPLCRKLLEDEHPGIQLEAAIWLGQSGLSRDPAEPRLFPMLVTALESKEKRQPHVDLSGWRFEQWPPGSFPLPARPPLPAPFRTVFLDEDEALCDQIIRALDRLERYLAPEQKDRLRRAEQAQREQRKKRKGT
jgi:hypothetical protein